jgi:hypothetical protein
MRAIFPSDARRKLCGKLIQQVPMGNLRGEHRSAACTTALASRQRC